LKLVEIYFILQALFCYGFNLNFVTFNQKVCKIILLSQHCCHSNLLLQQFMTFLTLISSGAYNQPILNAFAM